MGQSIDVNGIDKSKARIRDFLPTTEIPGVIFKTFLKQCTQSFNGTVLQKSLQPSKIPQVG